MGALSDALLKTNRARVVDDCVRLIDDEVDKKSGLSGLAIKGAYAVVKKIKPGFIREVVDHLLPDFVKRLEPFYDGAKAKGQPVEAYFTGQATAVADALLGITDARAKNVSNSTVRAAYNKLRPSAQKHVATAVPGVARVLQRYA